MLSDRDVEDLETWEQSAISCDASQGIHIIFLKLAVVTSASADMRRSKKASRLEMISQ